MRKRLPRLFGAVTAVAVLALFAAAAGWMRQQPATRQVVRFPIPMTSGQTLNQSNSDAPFALSPNGTHFAYVAKDSGAAAATLHLRTLDQFTTTSIPGTENAIIPFFSPDGLWLGFVTGNREIKKVAVSGGPVSQVAIGADRFVGAPSWGDDHGIVYTQGGVLKRVSDGGGASTPLADSTR